MFNYFIIIAVYKHENPEDINSVEEEVHYT